MHTQEKLAQVRPLVHTQHQVQRHHHLLPAVGDAGHAKAPGLGHAGESWRRPQKAHLERGGKTVRGVALDPEDERVIGARVHIGQGEPHRQFGGLGMQPGRREGPGSSGKVVPEM